MVDPAVKSADVSRKAIAAQGPFSFWFKSRAEGKRRDRARNPRSHDVSVANGKMIWVRHRSHATYSRQPRQVRKEATVTGSCVCSEAPVPGFFFPQTPRLLNLRYPVLHSFTYSFRRKVPFGPSIEVKGRNP